MATNLSVNVGKRLRSSAPKTTGRERDHAASRHWEMASGAQSLTTSTQSSANHGHDSQSVAANCARLFAADAGLESRYTSAARRSTRHKGGGAEGGSALSARHGVSPAQGRELAPWTTITSKSIFSAMTSGTLTAQKLTPIICGGLGP